MADVIVYQATDSRWLVAVDGVKSIYFNTEFEAVTMSEKIQFASEVQAICTVLGQSFEKSSTFTKIWADRQYLAGTAPLAITDADLESLGITKADLTAFITPFLVGFDNFMGGQVVAVQDYWSVINKLRTDK